MLEKISKNIVPALLLVLSLGNMHVYSAEVFLEMSRFGFRKIPLMILPFQEASGKNEAASIVENVLRADLERSLVFELIETSDIGFMPTSDGAPGAQALAKASKAGVHALVWAKLLVNEKEWILESYAYETSSREEVISIRISGKKRLIRNMAHRFSDILTLHFTGEKGIAQTKIAYVSDLSGNKEVYVMDYDGANKMRVTRDHSIVLSPRWSSNGKKLVYTSYRTGNPNIYMLDMKTGKKKVIASFAGLNYSATWSPVEDRIAFATTKDGNSEIYSIKSDGSDLKRLSFNKSDDLSPTWSPTGNKIAFTSDRGGKPQIYIMDADGANVDRLTFGGDYNTSPVWSPKGEWIAYACRNKERRLKICADRADGTQSIVVTESGPWDDEAPSWGLNGRELIFTSNRFGKNQIFSIHLDGSHLRRLTTSNPSNSISPAWSPR